MKKCIIIHYGEIALKKGNKQYFVDKLKKSLRDRLQKHFHKSFSVYTFLSRLMIPLKEDFDENELISIIEKIPGIKNFGFFYEGSIDFKNLADEIMKNLPQNTAETFVVRVKRSQAMKKSSVQTERDLGALLLQKGIDKKVKMVDADLEISIEFFSNHGYFTYKKYEGAGGLPPGSESKLVSLISAGIDSPVASYKMMRRGARIIFVHFHAYPYSDQQEMEHVKDLVSILSGYQFNTKLYLVPFGEIQKQIATNLKIPAKYRVVLYRRMMMRIAQRIVFRNSAKGLVTGESYGQVASQTPENMMAISAICDVPVYRPLIAMDKEDIVNSAEKIGTFEISKLPCKDTCAMFNPKHPVLNAKAEECEQLEENLPVLDMVKTAFKQMEIIDFK